ncbi:hypothetical protein G7054_g10689 [Neopestalotiopsis clavispora]|nr:hypothetical protein G7054_g10689 [Neopestalotiopsis clavispora]
MSDLDPSVIAMFGYPPPGIDLAENYRPRSTIVTALLLLCTILIVVLRFAAKKVHGASLYADDYAIVVALTSFMCEFFWVMAVSVTKLSILLLYRRLFAANRTRFRMWIDFLGFLVVAQIIANIVGNSTACRPVAYLWNRFDPGGAQGICFDRNAYSVAKGISNACLDIIVLATPIPSIWKLQVSAKRRLLISGMLLLGSLVCIASWIRVDWLYKGTQTIDTTWVGGKTAMWSFIETSLGIISACLPVMRPLFLKLKSNYREYVLSHKTSPGNSGASASNPASAPHFSARSGYEDTIKLTTIISGGESQERQIGDQVIVRSEIRQAEAFCSAHRLTACIVLELFLPGSPLCSSFISSLLPALLYWYNRETMARLFSSLAILIGVLSSIVYLVDRKLDSFYIFKTDHLHDLAKRGIAAHGNDTRAIVDYITTELHGMHPSNVNLKHEWFFNHHGGAAGSMYIIHASITEYLIIYGSAVGTEGHSGRHTADDYFHILTGEEWAYKAGEFVPEIYPAGSVHHLKRGEVKAYKIPEHCFALEYARGWIPPMMFFGFGDTFTSTLDFATMWTTTVVTAREMLRNLLVGKF